MIERSIEGREPSTMGLEIWMDEFALFLGFSSLPHSVFEILDSLNSLAC